MTVLINYKKIINNEKVFLWLISLILITLPLKHITNSILIIITFIYIIIGFISNIQGITLKINKVSFAFVSIYLLSVISLLWTIDINDSLLGLSQKLSYLILPAIFALGPQLNSNSVNTIYKYFSYAITVYALYCFMIGFYHFFTNGNNDYLFYHKLSEPLNSINAIYMSSFTAFSLLFFFFKNIIQKIDYICLFILSVFLVLLSSKIIIGTILGIIVVSAFFFKTEKKPSKTIKYLFLVILLLATIFLSKNILNRFDNEIKKSHLNEVLTKSEFGQTYYWTGSGLRLFQIRIFSELFKEDGFLLTGYGIDASQKKLKQKYMEYNLYPGFYHHNFHNQYIQIFAELGIFGLLVLLSIFIYCFKKAYKNNNIFFLLFITLIAILCLTETFLWRQRGMVFFITVTLLFLEKTNNYYSLKN